MLTTARRIQASVLPGFTGTKLGILPRLALFPIACGIASMFAGQDTSWDMFNYQWYDPYALLDGRYSIDVFPAGVATTVSPFIDVPYYTLMHALPPLMVGGLVGAVQGLNAVIVFFIAKEVSASRWVAPACAITASIGGGFVYELGSASADSLVSIPLLLGVLVAVRAVRHTARTQQVRHARLPRPAGQLWLLSGICEGIGAGLKLAEIPFALAATGAVVFTTRGTAPRMHRLLLAALGLLLGLVLSHGYWAVFLWHRFGDPVFGDLSSVRFFPSKFIVRSDLPMFVQQTYRYLPNSWVKYLLYPFYWTLHPYATSDSPILDLSIPLAYLLALVLGAGAAIRSLARRGCTVHTASPARAVDAYLICTFVLTLAVWGKMFGIYRYLIVLELLAPVVIFSLGRRGLVSFGPYIERYVGLGRVPKVTFFGLLLACVLAVLIDPPGFGSRVGYAGRFISLSTPRALRVRRPDVVIQEEAGPTAMFDAELPRWVTAVGYLDGLNTPATLARVRAAVSRARRAGGAVVIDYSGTPSQVLGTNAPANDEYLRSEGVTGYELQGAKCQVLSAKIGSASYPLTFCTLARIGREPGQPAPG